MPKIITTLHAEPMKPAKVKEEKKPVVTLNVNSVIQNTASNAYATQKKLMNESLSAKLVENAYNDPLSNPFGKTKAQQMGAKTVLSFAGVDTDTLGKNISAAQNAAVEPIRQSVSAGQKIEKLDEEIEQMTAEAKEKKKAEDRFMLTGYNPDNIDYASDDYLHSSTIKRQIAAKEQERAALSQRKTALDNSLTVQKIKRNGDENLFEELYALDYDEDTYRRDRTWNPDAQNMLNETIRKRDELEKQLAAKGYDVNDAYTAYKTVTNDEKQKKRNAAFEAVTKIAPGVANAAALLTAPVKGAAGIMGFLNGETGPSNPYNVFNDLSSTVTQTTTERIGSKFKNPYLAKGAQVLYSAAISAAESYFTMKTGGKFGELLMSLNAATQTFSEAQERGLSSGQAFGTAFAAGVFEALFEHVSLERIRALEANPGKGMKTFLMNTLKQFFTEGTEEGFTEIANELYDYLANGGLSNARVAIQNYIDEGMKPGDAANAYALDFAKQVGEVMIEGGISGAMMGAYAQGKTKAFDAAQNIYMGSRLKADVKAGEIGADALTGLTGIETKEKKGDTVVAGTALGTGIKYSKALEKAQTEYTEAKRSGNEEAENASFKKLAELTAINNRLAETKTQREYRKKIEALRADEEKRAAENAENIKRIGEAAPKLTTESSEKLMKLGFRAKDANGTELPVYGLRETSDGVHVIVDQKSGATMPLNDINFATSSPVENESLKKGYEALSRMITGTGEYEGRGKMSAAAANECIAMYSTFTDGRVNLVDFADLFYTAYGAGLNGLSADMFRTTETGRYVLQKTKDGAYLTPEQLNVAIEAGLRDYTPKTGLVNLTRKGTVNYETDAPILAAIDAHARKNGYTVILVDDAYENRRMLNGKTNGKVILLSASQKGSFLSVTAFHEAFHYAKMQSKENAELLTKATNSLMEYIIEQQGRDEYLVLFDERAPLYMNPATYREMKTQIDLSAADIREELKRVFGEEIFEGIEEEIAAEWYGTAKTVDLERFMKNEFSKEPSFWEQIKNKLREIVEDIMTKLTKLAAGNKTMANALKVAEADRVRITEFIEVVEKALANADNVHDLGKGAQTEKYSYAGEEAETADKTMLQRAKEMLAEGALSEDIRKATGWFKGMDGKWRFEISDIMSKLTEKPLFTVHGENEDAYYTAKLDKIFEHDELFKAYPQLKNILVIVQPTEPGVSGAFFKKNNQIVLSLELFKRYTKEYYDYLNGGRKAEIERIEQTEEYKEYSRFFDQDMDDVDPVKWLEEEKKARDKFFSSELGKRYYQLNWGKVDMQKYEPGWSKEAKSVLLHEIQHAVQEIEGFAPGGNAHSKEYDKVAGEIEARDVSERMNLTAEQRKEKRPDIDRTDVVFAEGSGASYDIGILENGNTYVIATRNIITSNDVAGMRKQITDFFNLILGKNKYIDIPTFDGDVLRITKKETAYKARDNYADVNNKRKKLSDDEFFVKTKAESHIDELVETSRQLSQSADKKNHNFAKNGFSYRVAYFQDFNGDYYKIEISVGNSNGIATVYNVGKIKEDKLPSAKLIAVMRSKPLGNMSSVNSISASVEKSNRKNEKNSYALGENESDNLKQKQLDVILNNNPAWSDDKTWIRTVNDIKTFDEVATNAVIEDGYTPDFTGDDYRKALKTGYITVYSSMPIKQGVFVSPSAMEARDYGGGKKPYSKRVKTTDVAWIDEGQGQYTGSVETEKNSFALGSEDTAELEEQTAGNETLEQQLEIVRNMAFAAAKKAAEKTLSVTNGKIAPKQDELLTVAKKALLDAGDEKAQKRIAKLLRDGINDIYTGAKTADTVIRETVDGIRKEALNAGYAEEYDTGGQELKKRMRGVTVKLDETTAKELIGKYGSMKNVRNAAMGKFFVTTSAESSATTIGVLYDDMVSSEGEGNPYGLPGTEEMNGDGAKMFDALIARINDSGTAFIRTADQMGFTGETLDEWAFQRAGEAISEALALTAERNGKLAEEAKKYKSLSETLTKGISEDAQRARAAAEKKAMKYAESLANSKKSMTSLEYEMAIEKYTSAVMFDELKRKYQERLDRAYAKRMDIRAQEKAKIQISKKVRRLNELVEREKDNKNVPEQLKSSFADFMRMFLSPDVGVFSEERLDRLIRAYTKMQNPMGDEDYIRTDLYEQYNEDIVYNLSQLKEVFRINGDKDWNKVRYDYITKGYGAKKLSEMHGFTERQILKKMYDEDWAAKREQYLYGNREQMKELLDELSGKRDGYVLISTLSLDDLKKVNEILDNVAKIIENANAILINGRREKVSALGTRAMNEMEKHKKKELPKLFNKAEELLRDKMLTPVYFFNEKLGGVFGELYEGFRDGQDQWYVKISGAKDKLAEIKQTYKYDDWKNEKRTITFSDGWTVDLDANALMQLYATIKREELAGADSEHLLYGGIVLGDDLKDIQDMKESKERVKAYWSRAHNFQFEDRLKIAEALDDIGENTKKYADEVVKYLSTDVGRWGNEASMQLSGIRKFTENYYFPFQSADNFIYRKAPTNDESMLKHASFTNRLQYGARTPLVVSNFTEIAASHIQQMALYSSLAVPIDNFNRVYNYKDPFLAAENQDGSNGPKRENNSVHAAMEDAYGKGAQEYISNFLKAVNGGLRGDENDDIWGKGTSIFKRSAVMANMSVVIQQPSAIARAMALINPVYFIGDLKPWHWKADYEEMIKHCPVAGIKAMGGFDTNTGVSATKWLMDDETKMDKINNALGIGAEFADAVTWTNIWNAVKRETRHIHKDVEVGSQQFYDICNKRFRDIADYTQVYDSTLSKNDLMRSLGGHTKMVTAFMAEPSLSFNLLTVSGKKKGMSISKPRALAAFTASVLLNAALKSIVGAWRDKDEEKTYWEKYISKFLGSLAGNKQMLFLDSEFSILTLIPWVKDVLSVFEGYDVERADMSVVSEAATYIVKLLREIWDENEEKFAVPEKDVLLDLVVSISNFTPVPAKSIYKDVSGIWANVKNAKEFAYESTKLTVRNAILDEIGMGAKKAEKAYRAVLEKDKETQRRMQSPDINKINQYIEQGYLPNEAAANATIDAVKDFHGNIAKWLAAKDDMVYKAAEELYSGDPKKYEDIVDKLKKKGFSQTDIEAAVDKVEDEKLRPKEKKEVTGYEGDKPIYETEDLKDAMANDNLTSFSYIREQLIENEKSESSINSSMKDKIKELLSTDSITETEAKGKLQNYVGMTADEADGQVYTWRFQLKYPESELSADNIKKYYAELEPQGISVETFEAYYNTTKKAEGKNKKAQVMEAIDALQISSEQKDAFYYYAGYKASTIYEAPWR